MPAGIAPSDRTLMLIGGALLVLMLAMTVVLSPAPEQLSSPVPSTYSGQPDGAEAAYLLLMRLHYPVRRWEEDPGGLPPNPAHVLLILADPVQAPTENEKKELAGFVKLGGHVLFTGSTIATFFPGANLSESDDKAVWKSFSPIIPSHLAAGAQHITMQPKAFWNKVETSQLALYGNADSPAVVTWKLGDGEILWWAGSTPLTNAGITRQDNLAFFLNSVSSDSADEPYQIYWDEYFHGERSFLLTYVKKTPLAWGLAQLGLLSAAILFSFTRRSGPVILPRRISRLSPLEFVDTISGLYERAGAACSAVSVSRLRLRSLMTRQLGLPGNTPDAELAEAGKQRLGWDDEIAGLLRKSADLSLSAKMKPWQALGIVQNLEHHAAEFGVRPRSRQEKN